MYARHSSGALAAALLIVAATLPAQWAAAQEQPVIRNITQASERVELTVNTSRMITLEKRIPKMVVNNPELLTVTALSANQVMLAATKPGVTQVNLWDEDGNVFSIDVVIYGDVKELTMALKRMFPSSSIKVMKLSNSLVLEGFVEKPEAVSPIVRLAEDYAPKVVNNIVVGGVQQVLLKVKVMEVSRTKLRQLGFDFAQFSSGGGIISSVSGLISSYTINPNEVTTGFGETVAFGVVNGNDAFFGFIDALQQNNVAKLLADPTLTAVSGRPAHFNVGGEFPIIIPSGLGQSTIEFKPYGTQVDFVPIVLGNGKIRLEVRPRVSGLDYSNGQQFPSTDTVVPALTVREVDTGVELRAGQTLALAGLVQTKVEAQERGIPVLCDMPLVGAAFRSVQEEVNEIELLILVTPEFADGVDPCDVPPCGPGMESMSPTNCELYIGGHLEVPACGPCRPQCAPDCIPGSQAGCIMNGPECGTNSGTMGCNTCNGGMVYATDGGRTPAMVVPNDDSPTPLPVPSGQVTEPLPVETVPANPMPSLPPTPGPGAEGMDPAASGLPRFPVRTDVASAVPVSSRPQQAPRRTTSTPGLIGPIGYDVEK